MYKEPQRERSESEHRHAGAQTTAEEEQQEPNTQKHKTHSDQPLMLIEQFLYKFDLRGTRCSFGTASFHRTCATMNATNLILQTVS